HKQRIEEANQFLARVKTILMSTLDHDQVIGKIASACVPYFADGCFIDLIEGESLNRILVNHKDPEKAAKIHELTKRFPAGLNSNRPSSKAIVTGEPILLNLNDTNVFSRYSDNSEHAQMVREIAWHSSISAPLRIRGKIIGSINFFNEAGRPELD